jgi:hypothetical protein
MDVPGQAEDSPKIAAFFLQRFAWIIHHPDERYREIRL